MTGLVLLALAFLLGMAVTTWTGRTGWRQGPTPTPTSTRSLGALATPDFRATQNLANLITQEAYRLASLGIETPTPIPTAPDREPPAPAPVQTPTPTIETPRPPDPAPDGSQASPTPTSTGTATPPETPTQTATATETPIQAPSATPSETPTPTPTQTPALATTFTPAPPLVDRLNGQVVRGDLRLRPGPSQRYPTLEPALILNQQVDILAHDGFGEWVYICCAAGASGWIRQAEARPTANPTVANFPPNSDINDVRWLPIRTGPDTQAGTASPTPTPTATLAPSTDYPLIGQNPWNQNRVDRLPAPPLAFAWAGRATAAQGLSSNVTVAGNSVLVASDDGHLYSFEFPSGNQRWRQVFNSPIRYGAAVQDRFVYVVDQSGTVTAMLDQGNRTEVLWQQPINLPPTASINIAENTLLISGATTTAQAVIALDRNTSQPIWRFNVDLMGTSTLQRPIPGHGMVYVGGRFLWAVDLHTGAEVWRVTDLSGVSTAPVYAWPGMAALAELFVADDDNRVRLLDANTSRQIWNVGTIGRVTGMALDSSSLYVSGNGFLQAFNRRTGESLWSYTNIVSDIVGGPIVGNGGVMVAIQAGALQIFGAQRGESLHSITLGNQVRGAPAVANGWIFVPTSNESLFALRSSQ